MSFLTKIFGSRNQRLIKTYHKNVRAINALEPQMEQLSDAELQAKTPEFKQRLASGASLDDILVEAFAVCREAAKRVMKMRHFDVQLIGGMVLHYGKIAEMGTGEGKTLMATLPVYLNALSGKGVHVVTVNDYLAQRDAEQMGRLYGWLGLTTGVNLSQMDHATKQAAYGSDITYGTNNEYGFDYLRDNMVYDARERVQRTLNFAVVDEVDSILIDEARTPLIISGQAENHTDLYHKINEVPPMLTLQIGEETPDGKGKIEVPGDYTKDEKAHTVLLTEAGHEKAEAILTQMGLLPEGASLYDAANITLIHHLYAALRAHVQEAREFADGALRQALSRGDRLPAADAQAVAQRYAELAGVSPEYVLRSDLRVLDPRFRKELLRDQGLVVGRYDGRVSGFDLDAVSDDETFVADDAFISPAYGALVNTYLREELGWTGTQERRAFSEMDWESTEPGKGWVWQHKQPGHTKTMWDQTLTYPQVMPDLAAALVCNPRLKVLVANGYFDLATPFFQTEYDIDHLGLPAPLRSNIAFTYYPAGHMVYTSPGCLEKLVEDLRGFYTAGVGAVGAGGVAGAAGATGAASALRAARVSAAPVDLSDLDERPDLPPLGLG